MCQKTCKKYKNQRDAHNDKICVKQRVALNKTNHDTCNDKVCVKTLFENQDTYHET